MSRKRAPVYAVPQQGTQEEKINHMLTLLEMNSLVTSFHYVAERVNKDRGTFHDGVEMILEKEIHYREEHRISRWTQQANFLLPGATLDNFDFPFQPTLDRRIINDLASCRFIEQGANVIFLGPTGVGKTHLAIGLGREAIEKGYDVRCIRLENFKKSYETETENLISPHLYKILVRCRLLILDEMGISGLNPNSQQMLYALLYQRHHRNLSTIFTSNVPTDRWSLLFEDEQQANIALDRILEKVNVITIDGPSYRMKDKNTKTTRGTAKNLSAQ